MPNLNHNLDEETPVCIRIDGDTLVVSPDPVPVWIAEKTRLHWFLCGKGTIDRIDFGQNHPKPFQKDHAHANSKRHVLSDVVVDKQHEHKQFKYTVLVTPAGGKQLSLDPNVQVMPYP